jgi:hypothetical protein
MDKGYTIETRGDHIHLIHGPDFRATRETMLELWAELSEVCEGFGCARVLVEAPSIHSKMDTTAVFESGTRLAQISPGVSVAMYAPQYSPDELSEFFKTVARNRGACVEFFTDKQEALTWLRVERTIGMP